MSPLAEITTAIDRAEITPSTVHIEWPPNDGTPRVSIACRYQDDLAALCGAVGCPMPEGVTDHAARQTHFAVTTKAGWVLTCVRFPHHPEANR